jgi:pyruvate ferredoxin oxidoreductase delta subunit
VVDTGSWRVQRPVVDQQKCTKCQLCWVYCPEAVIDRKEITIDYRYCKGCGVCAVECPTGAISMEKEE